MPADRDDALLLRHVAAGDTDALRALYSRYGAVLFGLALRTLGDRQLAEDCVQEVFVTAWRSAGRYDPRRASVSTWLFSIARNKTVDALRRRSRRPAEPLPERWPDDEAPDAADVVVAGDQGERVASALAKLPPHQLEAVSLAYFEGLTQAEIAARLGVPLGTSRAGSGSPSNACAPSHPRMRWRPRPDERDRPRPARRDGLGAVSPAEREHVAALVRSDGSAAAESRSTARPWRRSRLPSRAKRRPPSSSTASSPTCARPPPLAAAGRAGSPGSPPASRPRRPSWLSPSCSRRTRRARRACGGRRDAAVRGRQRQCDARRRRARARARECPGSSRRASLRGLGPFGPRAVVRWRRSARSPRTARTRLDLPLPGPGDYQAVDISVEPDGGPPEHSSISLAGGRFGS